MKKITLLLLLFSLSQLHAQIIWQNTIGGSAYDEPTDILETSDGGFLIIGASESNISGDKTQNTKGMGDYWIVKTNSAGVVQWDKTFGGTGDDFPTKGIETLDGGFVIVGASNSNISTDKTENSKGDYDYWVVKINSTGTKLWDKTIGGTLDDSPSTVQETATGDIVIGGYSNSNISGDKTENSKGGADIWIVKINSTGTVLWDKTFGGNGDDYIESTLKLTPDGGYIIGSWSKSGISGDKTNNSQGIEDCWILKISNTNTIDWQKTYGGSPLTLSEPYDVILTLDGGYAIAGSSNSGIGGSKTVASKGGSDFWILKLDSTGAIQWQKSIGGSNDEYPANIVQKADGTYVIAGDSYSNISGDKTENNHSSNTDIWLVELDVNGNVTADKTFGTNAGDGTLGMILSSDGNLVIASEADELSGDNTEAPVGDRDFWILKINKNTLSTTKQIVEAPLKLYPVPAGRFINISSTANINKADIIDLNGRLLFSVKNPNGKVDVNGLTTGVYLIKLHSNNAFVTKRFVKQ